MPIEKVTVSRDDGVYELLPDVARMPSGKLVAELDYRPNKCKKTYRMVVVRKNISVQKGEVVLFDEIRT